jgi:hypothetical protein
VLAPDGTVDPWKLRPLGRLGGASYAPLREVVEITTDAQARTAEGEMLDLWRDLRRSTLAIVRRLAPEQVAQGGPPVGWILLHLAQATARLAGGAPEDRPWDPRWTSERLHGELERTGREFEESARVFTKDARDRLRIAIRHEAWHQGQIAAALRGAFPAGEIWGL